MKTVLRLVPLLTASVAALTLLPIAGCSRFQDVQTDQPIKWDTKTKQQCWVGKTEFDEEASYQTSAGRREMEETVAHKGQFWLTLAQEQHMPSNGAFVIPLCSDLLSPPSDPQVRAWWEQAFGQRSQVGNNPAEKKAEAEVQRTSAEREANLENQEAAAQQKGLLSYEVKLSVSEMPMRDGMIVGRSDLATLRIDANAQVWLGDLSLHQWLAKPSNPVFLFGDGSYNNLTDAQQSLIQNACEWGLTIYEQPTNTDLLPVDVCGFGARHGPEIRRDQQGPAPREQKQYWDCQSHLGVKGDKNAKTWIDAHAFFTYLGSLGLSDDDYKACMAQ